MGRITYLVRRNALPIKVILGVLQDYCIRNLVTGRNSHIGVSGINMDYVYVYLDTKLNVDIPVGGRVWTKGFGVFRARNNKGILEIGVIKGRAIGKAGINGLRREENVKGTPNIVRNGDALFGI